MTVATITFAGLIILAALGVLVKTLDYINKEVFPQVKTLAENVADLKTAHAVNAVQIEQNTARLDRQGDTQRALLLAVPPPATAPAPMVAAVPSVPAAEQPATVTSTPEPALENKSTMVDTAALKVAHDALGAVLASGAGSTDDNSAPPEGTEGD